MVFDSFVRDALLAGIGVALVAGPLGCFVLWNRMAYFGDSLAHSALLGVALGILSGIGVGPGVFLICCLFAGILSWLQQNKKVTTDAILGILAHGALAIALILIGLSDQKIDLHGYLFGDILTVRLHEIFLIYAGGGVILILLMRFWADLILMSLHEDLALAEGVPVFWLRLCLVFLMTIFVAISVRIVGVLLITALLIVPASAARHMVSSAHTMAIVASVLGLISTVGGLSVSLIFDTAPGPGIVLVAVGFYFVILLFSYFRR